MDSSKLVYTLNHDVISGSLPTASNDVKLSNDAKISLCIKEIGFTENL
jgi:hypothetical protein